MAAAAATQQQQMIRPGSQALKPGLLYTFFPRKNKLTACLNPVASWARCISMAAAFKRARAAGGCLRLSRPVNIRQGNFYKSSTMSITRLGGGGYRFADEHADLMKRTKHWMNNEACGYWKKNGEYMYFLIQGDPYSTILKMSLELNYWIWITQ